MKPSFNNILILIFILVVLGYLYRRMENKRQLEESSDNFLEIRNYLLLDKELITSKKPILWVHVAYEYNSSHWLDFGSRSSYNLNQPYLYLTLRSIVEKCGNSFNICIIDDLSFGKLIPDWKLDLRKVGTPILTNLRQLALMKILYIYGGMLCPLSFLCMKNLIGMYHKGIRNNKMFVCECINRNMTSTYHEFYPNINFCGSEKENPVIYALIDYMQRNISYDWTAQSQILGDFDKWVLAHIKQNKINMIDGMEIGIKDTDEEPILIENLMGQNYLKLYPGTYGIYIPSGDIIKRRIFEWFARMSEKQVLESDTIIGKYILLTIGEGKKTALLEPMKSKPDWVGFWKTPNYPGLYGLKPNLLGDNLLKVEYPGR